MIYGIDYETRTIGGRPADPPRPEPLRCGSCGKTVAEVKRAVWDRELLVGACCEVYIEHRCPACASDDLDVREYDYGTCRETGYRDAGEVMVCRACGEKGDPGDFEVRIGPAPGDHTDADVPAPAMRGFPPHEALDCARDRSERVCGREAARETGAGRKEEVA